MRMNTPLRQNERLALMKALVRINDGKVTFSLLSIPRGMLAAAPKPAGGV